MQVGEKILLQAFLFITHPFQSAYALLLLRSEIPNGMCAKLPTVAASNNRVHARNLSPRTLVVTFNRSQVNIGRAFTSQSLLLLLARATDMMVLFFTYIPFVVNHTINATPPERLQHYTCSDHNTSHKLRPVMLPLADDHLLRPAALSCCSLVETTQAIPSLLLFTET